MQIRSTSIHTMLAINLRNWKQMETAFDTDFETLVYMKDQRNYLVYNFYLNELELISSSVSDFGKLNFYCNFILLNQIIDSLLLGQGSIKSSTQISNLTSSHSK